MPYLQTNQTLNLWKRLMNEFSHIDESSSIMRADLWTYLSENCLIKTDRASMANSLEVRVPFLGNELLDLTMPWASSLHFKEKNKAILTSLSQRYLPECVWNRPKHGFSVPLKSYFNHSWNELCQDYINQAPNLAPFLKHKELEELWKKAKNGKASRRLVYSMIVLLIWLKKHPVIF
jgi:asparagine synthase (glutamine-hydrolysing)